MAQELASARGGPASAASQSRNTPSVGGLGLAQTAFAYEKSASLRPNFEESIVKALTLGIRDYTRKCG
ncbi:MAG: hypothetical protein AAB579_01080, partial [Patescibacteria group bacterium]